MSGNVPPLPDDNDRIVDQLVGLGFEPTLVSRFDGPWPCVCVNTRLWSGALTSGLPEWFDIFLPTRPVSFTEVTGGLRRKRFHYRRGVVGFNPPDETWGIEWTGLLEGVTLILSPATLERAAQSLGGMAAGPGEGLEWRRALSDHAPAIAHLGLDLARHISGGSPDPSLSGLKSELFAKMAASRYSRSTSRPEHAMVDSPQVALARDFIRNTFCEPLSVRRIAEHAGVSEGHINRLFRAEMGTSVWAYVRKLRLEHAHFLLRRGELSISDVTSRVGYTSRQTFSAQFKARYGCRPAALLETCGD